MLENIQAEALLLKFEEELAKWEIKVKDVEDEKFEIYKIKQIAQEVCTHPKTREESTYDYHKREDWTNVFCCVCDKRVERY